MLAFVLHFSKILGVRCWNVSKITRFPKQCLHWRGSSGVGKEGAMVPSSTRSWYASANFCCYFTYFVHVTFATLQRIGRFFQICCKLQYKINVFDLRWSLIHLGHRSCIFRMIFWWYLGDILTKYDKKWPKVQFLQNGHVSKFQKCLFFRNKSPCGSILTEDSFWKLTPDESIHFRDNLKTDFFQFWHFW